jgi:hypothetical protein
MKVRKLTAHPHASIFKPAPGHESLLVLFFRKEPDSSFSEEREKQPLFLGLTWRR